jgi:hypothetical protein
VFGKLDISQQTKAPITEAVGVSMAVKLSLQFLITEVTLSSHRNNWRDFKGFMGLDCENDH